MLAAQLPVPMNTTRVDTSHSNSPFPGGAAMSRLQSGLLAGETVVVTKSAIAMLEDSREEISMAYSEKAERKRFTERRVGGASPVQLMRVEQLNAYLDSTRRYDAQARAAIVRDVQAGRLEAAASTVPADRFTLLQLALHDARQRSLPAEVMQRLQDALDGMEIAFGSVIRAGLNSADAAGKFAPTGSGVRVFQKTYSDIVLGESTFSKTLTLVLQRLAGKEGDDLQRGLHALLHALGTDLGASRSSTDPLRLQSLVQDIYQMEVVCSVLDDCKRLAADIATRFGANGVVPFALMQELVMLTAERWVAPLRLRQMAEKFALKLLLERIAFHAGTRSLLRKMPVQVFADLEAREGVLDSAQALLDELIAEEEQQVEEEERGGRDA